jgi:hypothetical protein
VSLQSSAANDHACFRGPKVGEAPADRLDPAPNRSRRRFAGSLRATTDRRVARGRLGHRRRRSARSRRGYRPSGNRRNRRRRASWNGRTRGGARRARDGNAALPRLHVVAPLLRRGARRRIRDQEPSGQHDAKSHDHPATPLRPPSHCSSGSRLCSCIRPGAVRSRRLLRRNRDHTSVERRCRPCRPPN